MACSSSSRPQSPPCFSGLTNGSGEVPGGSREVTVTDKEHNYHGVMKERAGGQARERAGGRACERR